MSERAEIERLQEKMRNRDYALDRLGELKDAEIERLQERVASLQASSGYEASIAQVEVERLRATLKTAADQIERLAFEMPPTNQYTPQFVTLANSIRAALESKP